MIVFGIVLSTLDWNKLASSILKAELKRRSITYEQLITLLDTIGIHETRASILNKMSRGAFQFTFFLQCSAAIGITNLRLDEIIKTPDL